MRAQRLESLETLKEVLLGDMYLDQPDWKEALDLLESPQETPEERAPESSNPDMVLLYKTAMRVAAADTTILVLGQSGVGKSRLARLIHESSPRRKYPFITVSCGSIPENLLESELFGVEKGAYTGANRSREGRFQKAHGGTIFLDEIGELTPQLQVKLLRVIQEKKIEPLGSAGEIDVDVRLIAATNRNLEEDTASGRFREDLYFRLNVVPLTMSPLNQRKEDILNLTRYFLRLFEQKDGVHYDISDAAIESILLNYSWPGNIRELENCMERMAVLSDNGILKPEDFPPRILREVGYKPDSTFHRGGETSAPSEDQVAPVAMENVVYTEENFPTLKDMENNHIKLAMQTTEGNVNKAAQMLKIHRNTLTRKLEDLNLTPASFRKKQP